MADRIPKPQSGTRIDYKDGKLIVPDDPIVPFIEGDGTGADIWRATRYVLDGAVEKVYGGEKKIHRHERFFGGKARTPLGGYPPPETLHAHSHHPLAIKDPLSPPVGVGRPA